MEDQPDFEVINPVAHALSKKYRMVERDDIRQEIVVWWLEHPKQVARHLDPDDEYSITGSLFSAGERYCRGEKAAAAGYHVADEFFYDVELVRRLLPLVWHPDRMFADQGSDENSGRGRRPPQEGNNLPAMVADVAQGLERLEGVPRALLTAHFGGGVDYAHLAESLGISKKAVEMKVLRAIKALVRVLGGRNPWPEGPGTRRVVSNAAAQAATQEAFNG